MINNLWETAAKGHGKTFPSCYTHYCNKKRKLLIFSGLLNACACGHARARAHNTHTYFSLEGKFLEKYSTSYILEDFWTIKMYVGFRCSLGETYVLENMITDVAVNLR